MINRRYDGRDNQTDFMRILEFMKRQPLGRCTDFTDTATQNSAPKVFLLNFWGARCYCMSYIIKRTNSFFTPSFKLPTYLS